MAVKPIPQGYNTATPYLIIRDAAKAIDYYKKAFGAEERMRFPDPTSGKIGHAEIQIGDSVIMLADEYPDMGFKSPESIGGTPVSIMLYVNNVDDVFARATSAGAKAMRPVKDQFYGDRSGTLTDPFGHVWTISTHVEDVPPGEMEERAKKAMKEMGSA